jgi:hypothetical protein
MFEAAAAGSDENDDTDSLWPVDPNALQLTKV